MSASKQWKWLSGLRMLALTVLTVFLLAMQSAWAQQMHSQEVRLPNQDYVEVHRDLRVKVLGGYVDIQRVWTAGHWYLNPYWANLRFHPDPMGGVLYISRIDRNYTRVGNGAAGTLLFSLDEDNFIRSTQAGWQWYDRVGNRIDYDMQGRITSYADLNDVTVYFERDNQGRLTLIRDHHRREVMRFVHDAAGLVTQVQDTMGRSVHYTWSNGNLVQITDVRGGVWQYVYNSAGYITERVDPSNARIALTYMSTPTRSPASAGFAGLGIGFFMGNGTIPLESVGTANALAVSGVAGDLYWTGRSNATASTKVSVPMSARVASFTDEVGGVTNYRVEYQRTTGEYQITTQLPGGEGTQVMRYDRQGDLIGNTLSGVALMQMERVGAQQINVKNERGLVTSTYLNSAGLPIKIVSPDGSSELFTYEAALNRQTSFTNAQGVVSTRGYDRRGNVLEWVEAVGLPEQRTSHYAYDQWGSLLEVQRGAGNGKGDDAITVRMAYDEAGNVSSITNGLGAITRRSYNVQGLPVSEIDALGHERRMEYDAAGNLIRIIGPLPAETRSLSYDAMGRLVSITSALGYINQLSYDAAGRMIAAQDAAGAKVALSYGANGLPIRATTDRGSVEMEYDQQGRVVRVTDVAGNTTRTVFGAVGSSLAGLVTETQYPTYRESYGYNLRGQRTRVTRSLGLDAQSPTETEHIVFDNMGQVVGMTNALGHSSQYSYDALGRRVEITDNLGNTSRWQWNAFDKLIALQTAKGQQYLFGYDKALRQTSETRPLGGVYRFAYDAIGQLTQRTDPSGHTQRFQYDAAGRLVAKLSHLAGVTLDEQTDFSWDADSRMTGYEQRDGQGLLISAASYTHDAMGRTIRTLMRYGKADGSSFTQQFGRTLNANGLVTQQEWPDGSQGGFTYDAAGQLQTVTPPGKPVGSNITFSDYSWGIPRVMSLPGATLQRQMDALQRLQALKLLQHDAQGQPLSQPALQRDYVYDAAGNITQIQTEQGTTTYTHDAMHRLLQATPDASLQAQGMPLQAYTYDVIGNRTSSLQSPGDWIYNEENQLLQYPASTLGIGGTTIQRSYTTQGHLQAETGEDFSRSLQYNANERMTQVLQKQGQSLVTIHYQYDPFGRRISQRVVRDGHENARYFVNDEETLLAEVDGAGAMSRAYGWYPGMEDLGQWAIYPMWQADVRGTSGQMPSLSDAQTEMHFMANDQMGTPLALTNAQGALTWSGNAQAFGAMVVDGNSTTRQPWRLPGQYADAETGWHQNYRRDYDPFTGQYIQADPLSILGGENIYGYAGQSPLRFTDPNGEIIPLLAGAVTTTITVAKKIAIPALKGINLGVKAYYDKSCFSWRQIVAMGAYETLWELADFSKLPIISQAADMMGAMGGSLLKAEVDVLVKNPLKDRIAKAINIPELSPNENSSFNQVMEGFSLNLGDEVMPAMTKAVKGYKGYVETLLDIRDGAYSPKKDSNGCFACQ